MRLTHRLSSVFGVSIFVLSLPLVASAQFHTHRWDASSGQYPNSGCPAWVLQDNAPLNPVLAGGKLTLSTNATNLNMYYQLLAPNIGIATPTVIEFRCRFVSGASSTPSRAGIMVNFHKGGLVVTALAISADRVSLLNGDLSVGSSAVVDTDGAFHTYQIVNNGTAVQIFYDSTLLLSGSTYVNANAGNNIMIVWGEASGLAHGISEWEFVEINNLTDACPVAIESTTWGKVKSLYR